MSSSRKKLDEWRKIYKSQVRKKFTPNSKIGKLNAAARNGETIKIIYRGGSSPGVSRNIRPKKIYKKQGYDPIYVEAFCEKRGENRNFRLDKISIVSTSSDSKYSVSKILKFIILAIIILIIYYIFN
jgi:predicted DNA-binding transcriptional regulator YafY